MKKKTIELEGFTFVEGRKRNHGEPIWGETFALLVYKTRKAAKANCFSSERVVPCKVILEAP